jgi:hypothetical protein
MFSCTLKCDEKGSEVANGQKAKMKKILEDAKILLEH